MKTASLSILLALLPAAVRAAADPAKYNEAVNATYRRLGTAGGEFGEALRAWSTDPKIGVAKLRKSLESMEKAVADVRADSAKWEVPESDEAKAFAKSYAKFLDAEDAIVKMLAKLVADAEKAGDKGIDMETLQKSRDEIGKVEEAAVRELDEKQQAYLKKHGIKGQ